MIETKVYVVSNKKHILDSGKRTFNDKHILELGCVVMENEDEIKFYQSFQLIIIINVIESLILLDFMKFHILVIFAKSKSTH